MQAQILLWSLIMMRVSGFVLINPIFGRRGIPGIVKAGLIMALSIFLFNLPNQEVVEVGSLLEYIVLLLKEFVIGYVVGFVISLFQYIIVLAGGVIDFQMGLSMATIYDAQSNSSLALSATMLNIMFMLVFFAIDGHIALFQMLINLRNIVPYGTMTWDPEASQYLLKLFAQCTLLGVQLAFPIIAMEFIGEIGVGILMKTIPQINIFAVNIQMKVFIGLSAIVLLIVPMGDFVHKIILEMIEQLKEVISLL